uniref:J domain-containing protein n=1 Tax=Oryza brachyantha TaxID=4533 RepID=J3MGC4_ORYBR
MKNPLAVLAVQYHPDVTKESDGGVHFQRINVAYQMVMGNLREAEERLEYWRLKYGLDDEDLDKYRSYLNDDDDDDGWFDA